MSQVLASGDYVYAHINQGGRKGYIVSTKRTDVKCCRSQPMGLLVRTSRHRSTSNKVEILNHFNEVPLPVPSSAFILQRCTDNHPLLSSSVSPGQSPLQQPPKIPTRFAL